MSSASIKEQEPQIALPSAEPAKALPAPESPKGGAMRKLIVVLVILLAVGAAVWKIRQNTKEQAVQSQKLQAAADRPVPVQTVLVQQKTMPIFLTQLGTVTAYNTVTIKSRVDGQLMTVNVTEGQRVRKGDLLVEIDPKPYQAAVEQAQGQLVKDEANAVNAQAEAARYTALLQAGVVSKESQQAQISTAGQAQGAIDADKAAIQAAKVNLGYTKITSPIDGVVGLRQVDAGNIVHASDTTGLLVVTQLQPIAVIFTIPEDRLPEVLKLTQGGHKLAVEAYDRSGATHLASGSLLTVDNQIDTTTGTVKAKAVFDNKDGALFPNQFVNVRLILQERPNAIVVPAAALQTGSQGTFVFVVKQGDPPANLQDNGSTGVTPAQRAGKGGAGASGGANGGAGQNSPHFYVEARPVNVELTEGAQVILNGGVNPGDPIVVDGQEKLRNGSRVIPRQATPRAHGTDTAAGGSTTASPDTSHDTSNTGQAGQSGQHAPQAGGNGGSRP
jgi:membrane fusion protein, multidrug efflux system